MRVKHKMEKEKCRKKDALHSLSETGSKRPGNVIGDASVFIQNK